MATQRTATKAAPARQPRKRAAPAPKAEAASSAPIKLYTKKTTDTVEMVPLFSIDDVDYLIPARPNALMALRFLEEVKRTGSQDMAMGVLLEELLGAEAYQALLAFQGHMEPDELAQLFQAAQAAVVGLVEVPKGD